VFLGHNTLCPYDQNRQSKKTFDIRYNSNDSAATAPEPFEIWGAILSGKMPESRAQPQSRQIQECQPKNWYNDAVLGGVDLGF
jgi:hypothetical protein